MKVAFFLEADSKNPGGYNQTLSTVTFINEKNKHNEDIIYVANSENLKNKLTEKGINSLLYKRTFFDKLINYYLGLSFLFKGLIKFNLQHSFTKFFKKNNIDLIFFLSPSNLSLFCGDINFVLSVWDLDHKKDSPFPEHRENFIFEKREFFLNNVLSKAFKVIVPHNRNKEDLIKFYNCNKDKILVQTLIPYLPKISKKELKFTSKQEEQAVEDLPINKKIILYPASFWAHKNHKYILDSAMLLKQDNINDFYFVMCGADRGVYDFINQFIKDNNISDKACTLPLISNFCLKTLYEKCFAVIMPTDTGPTNLPLYEAMFFKKPIFYSINILDDAEIGEVIIPINVKDPNSFVDKLKNLEKENISKKIELGKNYYKNFCNDEAAYGLYFDIITEFKKILNQWKK
jgi:hypothetical protein